MATSHRFSCAAAWRSEAESSGDELRDHLVAGSWCGRVDQANDPALVSGGVQEGAAQGGGEGCQSALGWRERADKTESRAHSSGAFRSDGPERTENEASRSKMLRLAGSVCARPTAAIRLRSWRRPRGASTRCAATAGLARRTKGATTSAYPKTGTAGDGSRGWQRSGRSDAATRDMTRYPKPNGVVLEEARAPRGAVRQATAVPAAQAPPPLSRRHVLTRTPACIPRLRRPRLASALRGRLAEVP